MVVPLIVPLPPALRYRWVHVESVSVLDFHRSSRAELDAVQTRLRVATDEAKMILERHAEALGIARRNRPWGG